MFSLFVEVEMAEKQEYLKSSEVVIPAIGASLFVYNICLTSISNTVSDGATKTLVLNIERTWHDQLSTQGILARCIEYL